MDFDKIRREVDNCLHTVKEYYALNDNFVDVGILEAGEMFPSIEDITNQTYGVHIEKMARSIGGYGYLTNAVYDPKKNGYVIFFVIFANELAYSRFIIVNNEKFGIHVTTRFLN